MSPTPRSYLDGVVRLGLRALCALVFLNLIAGGGIARDRNAAKKAYERAVKYYQQLQKIPREERTAGRYDRAVLLFTLVLDHDPSYGACDDSLWAMASLYEEQYDRFGKEAARGKAVYYYEFLAREYPLTRFRDPALARVASLRESDKEVVTDPASAAAPLQKMEGAEPERATRATVTAIRYWSTRDSTRAVIELDREIDFTKSILSHPDRLYFDLHDARLEPNLEKTYEVNDVSLRRIRVAQNRPGVVRVVLDFEQISRHSVFALLDPFRLVIDTRGDSTPVDGGTGENQTLKTAEAVIQLDRGPSARQVLTEKPAVPLPASQGSMSLTRVLGLKVGRIALDPGHGGHDHGTVGGDGLREKDLVLDISLRLKDLLESRLQTEVVLTRNHDRFVPLEERTAIANNEGADLLISIHANSTRNRSVSGVETFFLSFAADPDELEVASRENASSQLTIRELEGLLHKIALDDFSEESRDLASVVQHNLHSTIALHRSRWRDRGVKKAPFVVLINSAMPSILTEIGFLSNPDDERFLASEKGKNQIAEALYKGVEEYFRALGNPSPYEKADTEGSR